MPAIDRLPILTVREVARILRLREDYVRHLARSKQIRFRLNARVGSGYKILFEYQDVIDYIEANYPRPEDFDHPSSPRSSKWRLAEKLWKNRHLRNRGKFPVRTKKPDPASGADPA